MKKIKYLLFAAIAMVFGLNSAFAASVEFPSTIEVKVGETKNIEVSITDLAIIGDVTNSDTSVVKTDSNSFSFKTDGNSSKTETFAITGVKVGEATLTFTSDDASIYSTESSYDFTDTNVIVKVVEATVTEETTTTSSENNSIEETKAAIEETTTVPTTEESTKVSNPKTGVYSYIIPAIIVISLMGVALLYFSKKGELFKKI